MNNYGRDYIHMKINYKKQRRSAALESHSYYKVHVHGTATMPHHILVRPTLYTAVVRN